MPNQYVYAMTDTWDDTLIPGGSTFDAIKMAVTDTSSQSGSRLLDLLVGGVSQFRVTKTGNTTIAGTLDVTGATTLAGLSATTGSFSSTLGVTGAATLSSTLAVTGRATIDTMTVGLGGQTAVASNTAVGFESLNSASLTGNDNTAIGYRAGLSLTTGNDNTLVGQIAADTLTTGAGNVCIGAEAGDALTTASSNVLVGTRAGRSFTTSGFNTIIGHEAASGKFAGTNNTFLGYRAGWSAGGVNTGDSNIFIGSNIGGTSNVSANSNIIIGNSITVDSGTTSNQINIGGCYFHDRIEFAASGSTRTVDMVVRREAANELALRNAANAQTLRLYNTFTSATDFERLNVSVPSNVFTIQPERGSAGGTARELRIAGTTAVGTDIAGADVSVHGGRGTGTGGGGAIVFSTADAGSSGTAANAVTERFRLTGAGVLDVAGGVNLKFATSTGTKIGTATSELIGFYGVTPVDQPATVTDPTGGGTQDAEARTAINAIIDRLQELGLIA